MILSNIKLSIVLLLLIPLYSCQKIEYLDKIEYDYSKLFSVTINAFEKKITNFYEVKSTDLYLDESLINPSKNHLNKWLTENIKIFGNKNYLEINIIDTSLRQSIILNKNLKKYQDKEIFLFEINFLVEFLLYDNSKKLIASSIIESARTTTAGKYLSINQKENIIDKLVFDCLIEFSKKTDELLKLHMKDFIL